MIEGVRQWGAQKQIWRHNDVRHLEELLRADDPERPKLILCESLYSMDGESRRYIGSAISPSAMPR